MKNQNRAISADERILTNRRSTPRPMIPKDPPLEGLSLLREFSLSRSFPGGLAAIRRAITAIIDWLESAPQDSLSDLARACYAELGKFDHLFDLEAAFPSAEARFAALATLATFQPTPGTRLAFRAAKNLAKKSKRIGVFEHLASLGVLVKAGLWACEEERRVPSNAVKFSFAVLKSLRRMASLIGTLASLLRSPKTADELRMAKLAGKIESTSAFAMSYISPESGRFKMFKQLQELGNFEIDEPLGESFEPPSLERLLRPESLRAQQISRVPRLEEFFQPPAIASLTSLAIASLLSLSDSLRSFIRKPSISLSSGISPIDSPSPQNPLWLFLSSNQPRTRKKRLESLRNRLRRNQILREPSNQISGDLRRQSAAAEYRRLKSRRKDRAFSRGTDLKGTADPGGFRNGQTDYRILAGHQAKINRITPYDRRESYRISKGFRTLASPARFEPRIQMF